MYAIVETGGKQYKIAEKDTIIVERLPAEKGDEVELPVLALCEDSGRLTVGDPYVTKAKVIGRVIRNQRGPKIRVFKYKPKKRYKRTHGHRQEQTLLRVEAIQTGR